MKLLFILLSIFSCLYISGCGGDANAKSSSPESEIELLHKGNYITGGSNTIKQSKVITSAAYYQDELLLYSNEQPSNIDFSNNQVLLIDMGTRATGGYSVSIDNSQIFIDEHSVTVNVLLTTPGANCLTTQALTTPYAFYRIPTQKEILVQEELVVTNCN